MPAHPRKHEDRHQRMNRQRPSEAARASVGRSGRSASSRPSWPPWPPCSSPGSPSAQSSMSGSRHYAGLSDTGFQHYLEGARAQYGVAPDTSYMHRRAPSEVRRHREHRLRRPRPRQGSRPRRAQSGVTEDTTSLTGKSGFVGSCNAAGRLRALRATTRRAALCRRRASAPEAPVAGFFGLQADPNDRVVAASARHPVEGMRPGLRPGRPPVSGSRLYSPAMQYAETVLDLVGNTPLVRITRVTRDLGHQDRQPLLLAKMEMLNGRIGQGPDRPADDRHLRARGAAQPGGSIIEPTSGNTGHGLAITAALGLSLHLRDGRQAIDREAGAAPRIRRRGRPVSTNVAPEFMGATTAWCLAGTRHPEGIQARPVLERGEPRRPRDGRGPELWDGTDGRITHFVASVGTVGRSPPCARKERNPTIQVIGAEPELHPVRTRHGRT